MFRGTTPTLRLTVTGLPIDTFKDIYITLNQNGTNVITLTDERLTLDVENNKIIVRLTERETMALNKGNMQIQMRALTLDGSVVATNTYSVTVKDIFYEAIIGDDQDG